MKTPFILKSSIRLDRLFQKYGKNPALITAGASLTFGEIEEKLRWVIANLDRAGVGRQKIVALHGANSDLHLYLFLAAWVMDFLYVPMDFKAPLTSLLPDVPVDFLVTDSRIQDDIPAKAGIKLRHLSGVQIKTEMTPPLILRNPCSARKDAWPAVPFRQEASVIFTSGSTGQPRGIVHTVGNYIYSALGTNELIGLDATDRWLMSLPLFHVGGALIWVRTLFSGGACVLPESLQNLADAIREYRPSVLSLVPAQLIRLLETEGMIPLLKAMKTIMLGGAPTPGWLIDKSLELNIPIMPTYGCTESCAQATGVAQGSSRKLYFSAGKVAPYREIRVGKDGRILLGGKTLFKRYLHAPDVAPFNRDGFFKTADHGTMDEEGNLFIAGRTDGVFISGGENISPPEIENCLLGQDGVITAVVVPAPHREFGLTPWAFVETTLPFDEKSILNNLRRELPGYKLPKRIIRLTPDDRLGKMKYSRAALTELARTMAEGKSGKLEQTHLHHEETGPSDAPAFVFLHGFMGRASAWQIIMKSLAASFRCIAFDLPGHGASLFGASGRLRQLRGMEDTARLLLEDLDALGVGRFTLYGYSMGGRLAQHAAIASPGRINRLILESASFGIADDAARTVRLQRDRSLMSHIKTEDDFRAFLTNWYDLPLFRTLQKTAQLHALIEEKLCYPAAEYQRALNILSVGNHDYLATKLAACRVPVYYFCGGQDEAYRQTTTQIRQALPEMTVKIFKNASHNIHIQYPQEIVSAIYEILI